MTTAIIGAGNIGSTVARHLAGGDEMVVVAAKHASHADALAEQLGPRARVASVEDAIAEADAVVFALWLDDMKAEALAGNANRTPERAVLFYATDDDTATAIVERLIRVAGFEPFKVGGVSAAVRIEMPGGDLHQYRLNGEVLDLEQARAAIHPNEVPR